MATNDQLNQAANVQSTEAEDAALTDAMEQNRQRQQLRETLSPSEWADFTLSEKLGETTASDRLAAKQAENAPPKPTVDQAEADRVAREMGFDNYADMKVEVQPDDESEANDDDE